MNCLIVYSSMTGNTRKIAEAIKEELNCRIVYLDNGSIKTTDLNDIDLVFIGSGVYGGQLHKNIISFVQNLDVSKKIKFAFFTTWFGRGNSDRDAIEKCKCILQSNNHEVYDDYFKCYGRCFGIFRRNHPNKEELNRAKMWARNIIDLYKNESVEY